MYVSVVVTVMVTPVGKVVGDTEPDPAGDVVTVLDHTDDLEDDIETDPDSVDVLDWVVDAVTVFVVFTDPVIGGLEVPQGLVLCVFVL